MTRQRRWPDRVRRERAMPLLWRVFTINAAVLTAAMLALVVSPSR